MYVFEIAIGDTFLMDGICNMYSFHAWLKENTTWVLRSNMGIKKEIKLYAGGSYFTDFLESDHEGHICEIAQSSVWLVMGAEWGFKPIDKWKNWRCPEYW